MSWNTQLILPRVYRIPYQIKSVLVMETVNVILNLPCSKECISDSKIVNRKLENMNCLAGHIWNKVETHSTKIAVNHRIFHQRIQKRTTRQQQPKKVESQRYLYITYIDTSKKKRKKEKKSQNEWETITHL